MPRVNTAFLDKEGDFVRNYARFAASRACKHE
jgi:hypothetical protein